VGRQSGQAEWAGRVGKRAPGLAIKALTHQDGNNGVELLHGILVPAADGCVHACTMSDTPSPCPACLPAHATHRSPCRPLPVESPSTAPAAPAALRTRPCEVLKTSNVLAICTGVGGGQRLVSELDSGLEGLDGLEAVVVAQ